MTDHENTGEPAPSAERRAQTLRAFLGGMNAGELPAPTGIRFTETTAAVDLESIADLELWAGYFQFPTADDGYHYRHGQPYPDLADPSNSDTWIVTRHRYFNGWFFTLSATGPITDEQRQQWIDSGKAAGHAARIAAEAVR